MFFDLDRLDRTRFLGILVVPDVHGHPQALAEAATRAANDSLFLVQLGDLVDRGPASAKVVALMRDIEAAGVGTFLSGNHEYKLLKYVQSGSYGSPARAGSSGASRPWPRSTRLVPLSNRGRATLRARPEGAAGARRVPPGDEQPDAKCQRGAS